MRISNKYLAGFFDGEGSIGLYKSAAPRQRPNRSPSFRFTLMVTISNAHFKILKEIRNKFGGDIRNTKAHSSQRPVWSWRRQGRYSIPFLKAIQPYSVVKKPQIDLGLEYEEKYKNDGHGKPWQPIEERQRRVTDKSNYVRRFKQLKEDIFCAKAVPCRTYSSRPY